MTDTSTPTRTFDRTAGAERTVADDIAAMLWRLGVRMAFGVSGGGIAPLWDSLLNSAIETLHFHNEAGAAFAATEASVTADGPVAVFVTTGPGITNALTGVAAARAEGAKIVLVSPRTPADHVGRWAVQETSPVAMASTDLFSPSWLFDEVFLVESAGQLPEMASRLGRGFGGVGTYVAHLTVAVNLQKAPSTAGVHDDGGRARRSPAPPSAAPSVVDDVVRLLATKPFAIWAGYGARHAAAGVRALVATTGAPVMVTQRGKGIVPEDDPHYLGVTGIGGHDQVERILRDYRPERILVLGTKLSEPSSGWSPDLVPPKGFIHVDIDPSIPGTAYPDDPGFGVHAEIGQFLDLLLARAGDLVKRPFCAAPPIPTVTTTDATPGCVRPDVLMAALQRIVVDRTDIPVLVEPGSSMAWGAHHLLFRQPGRFRMTGLFGSMGHMVCGALGTAAARRGPALCLTGDGSLLMNNEINTAVAYGLPVVWVVLNDARYAMVEAGRTWDKLDGRPARFPECDFAAIAMAMGADGVQVTEEADLDEVLAIAVAARTAFVVDVIVDRTVTAPFQARFRTLEQQGR